jgi:parvulin-like peptidyl-prolyl isomerase
MIDEALLLKHAGDRGVKASEELLMEAEQGLLKDYQGAEDSLKALALDRKQWRGFLRDRLMIQLVLEELSQGVSVEDEEVLAYFRDHRELFVREREVRVRQIVVAQAAEAQDLLARARKGESFSALAKKHSVGPEAAAGGEMGFARPHQAPPELQDVVFSLEMGKVSEIIPSPHGFHIVRMEEERSPRELEYTEVQEEIRRDLLREKIQRTQKAWLEAQWKEADVQILDPRLMKGAGEGEKAS